MLPQMFPDGQTSTLGLWCQANLGFFLWPWPLNQQSQNQIAAGSGGCDKLRNFDVRPFKAHALSLDPSTRESFIFERLRNEAAIVSQSSPLLRATVERQILSPASITESLCVVLTDHLACDTFLPHSLLLDFFLCNLNKEVMQAAIIDLLEIATKDPAVSSSFLQPFLFYKVWMWPDNLYLTSLTLNKNPVL